MVFSADVADPEVAAETIVPAASEAPREFWVDSVTIKEAQGTMAAPSRLDYPLAHLVWNSEMTDEPAAPRADNLFEPVGGRTRLRRRFGSMSGPRAITASTTLVRGLALLMRRPSKPKDITPAELPAE
jgi:hypothetical protein